MQRIVPALGRRYDAVATGAAPGEQPGAGDRWRALAGVVRCVFASPDDRELSGTIVDGVLKLVAGEGATLFRSGAAEADVVAVASQGGVATPAIPVPDIAYPVVTRAISERRAIATPGDRKASAVLAVPLRGRHRVVGALAVTGSPGRGFMPLDIEIVETFADQTAAFLELIWRPADLSAAEDGQERVIEAERLRAVGQLAGGVAHHLNNIMTVILGNIHVALGAGANVGMRKQLESAERAVLEAADVVRRMSAFSRVRPVPVESVVDLNLLAADVLEWTRSRWQAEAQLRGITIRARLEAGEVPEVRGDEAGLREVLLNLVLNAIDALPDGGDIVVRTWHGEAAVYCSVSDNGVGMTPQTRQRALEPFFTTKGPQRRGLGLSVAYGVVQRHAGGLVIDSWQNGGSTATFSLPIESTRVFQPGGVPAPAESPRVLLIDDDPAVRTVLRAMLTRDGYTVVEATDGLDALNRLEGGESVDLVLTDLVMPDVNGWQLLRDVRRLRPGLPVVFITGWDQAGPEGNDVPDALVTKPVTDAELRETVAGVLARS